MSTEKENDIFNIFDQLTEEDIVEIGTGEEKTIVDCKHEEFTQDKNSIVCISCGKCLQKLFNQHREWRSQQTRVNTDEKNIYKDVESIQFSENIVQIANSLYIQVTNEKIYRGNARKGIISACIFHAFKIIGKPQIYKKIIKLFNINKKIGLKGLKFVIVNAPRNSLIFKTQITPTTFIEYYMEQLQANPSDIEYVKNLYTKIENNQNNKLSRSRPQSVASGVVYYWLLEENRKITLKTFAKITELSELTIVKIQKDIKEIFQNNK